MKYNTISMEMPMARESPTFVLMSHVVIQDDSSIYAGDKRQK